MIYQLSELQQAYRSGKTYEFLFFWGHTPPSDGKINESCLSQWFIRSVQESDVEFICCEQYMMAKKALLFHDREMYEKIMKSTDPKEMKAFGRLVKNFDKGKWNTARYEIVLQGNRAKFTQNQDLREFLCSTDGKILVEASPRDCIWGIGMGKNNPDAQNPLTWRGTNLLGFVLTQVRDELCDQNCGK